MELSEKKIKLIIIASLMVFLLAGMAAPTMSVAYTPGEVPALDNPLQNLTVQGSDQSATKKLSAYTGGAIQVVLSIVGSISLVIFIYAGIRYMLARGNAEEAKAAGKIMAWAAAGLFIIFGSYVILDFIFKALTG